MEGESNKPDPVKQGTPLEKIENMLSPDPYLTVGEVEQSHRSTFSREIDDYFCDFLLTGEGNLKIVLTSQLDASVYLLQMVREEKKVHEQLNFFDSIEEVYEYLQQNTVENIQNQDKRLVRIDEKGKIIIKVISILGKKDRSKEIFLQAQRIEEKKEAYLQNVIKKMSKSMMDLKKQISAMKQKQTSFQNNNQALLERIKSEGDRLQFIPDKSDPHFPRFIKKDKKVTKINDNNTYFNLVSEIPIKKTGNSYFYVRINETAQKNIIIGIGSKFIRGIPNAYTHPDFIGFYLYGQGYVWEKTNQRDLSLKSYPIENGALITTIVDMDLGFVCWQICRVKVAYAVIPLELKSKLLFPVVMMINVNDTILLP